jgi:hypothetical protein
MPANTTPVRICPNCDGFPVAHVSIGSRRPDGTLPTLPVACVGCSGTGRIPAPAAPARALAPAGR